MEKKIMIVEDDSTIRLLLVTIIKKITPKIKIIECENGSEALSAIDNDVCLVFSDNNMPIMSGFELVTRLKKNENFAHIPVVMISVEARQEYIDTGLNSGFSDWIVKPFQVEQIEKCLRAYL